MPSPLTTGHHPISLLLRQHAGRRAPYGIRRPSQFPVVLFWWAYLYIALSLFFLMTMKIDDQVTYGDLLGAFVAVVLALLGGAIWLRRLYVGRFPFQVRSSPEHINTPADHRSYFSSATVPLGQSTFLLRYRARRDVHLDEIDLRCVERRWRRLWRSYRDVSPRVVQVLSVDDVGVLERGPTTGEQLLRLRGTGADLVGAVRAKYIPPSDIGSGARVWLKVTIEAHEDWSGCLSLVNVQSRQFARFPVKARASQLIA